MSEPVAQSSISGQARFRGWIVPAPSDRPQRMGARVKRLLVFALCVAGMECIDENCTLAQAADARRVTHAATRRMDGEASWINRFVWISGGFYEGAVDDGEPLQMNVQFPTPPGLSNDDGFQFESKYWNPDDPENTQRDLAVQIAEQPNEVVGESINLPLSEKSMHIAAEWSKDYTELKGTLTKDGATSTRHFHLKLRYRYRTELRSWLVASGQRYGNRRSSVWTTYLLPGEGFSGDLPVLGLAVPAPPSTARAELESGAQTSEQLLIAWASDRYVFLRDTTWFYGFGAAHGLADGSFQHYAIDRGGYRALGLGDFYDVGRACQNLLMRKVNEALQSDGVAQPDIADMYLRQMFERPDKGTTDRKGSIYLVTPTGIEFLFGSNSLDDAIPHDIFVEKDQLGHCADHLPAYAQ